MPKESKTFNTEKSWSNGMPKRLLSIPEGQPEKVIRTGKRQSKREGKGKGRVKKKDIRRFWSLEGKMFRDVDTIVP